MLENSIRQEMTIGNYFFDESCECFWGDAEIELYICQIEGNKYQSECYFFDGYEIGLNEEQKIIFSGSLEEAKEKAVASFNSGINEFLGYSIYFKNICCNLMESE